jgi:ABC-type microcin C transport system duplicated ATPase subunit YejF
MPDEGEIWIGDTNIARLGPRALRPFRSRVQMVFQDPATAMNPRFSAAEVIGEPLLVQGHTSPEQRQESVRSLMAEVGLRPEWAGDKNTD